MENDYYLRNQNIDIDKDKNKDKEIKKLKKKLKKYEKLIKDILEDSDEKSSDESDEIENSKDLETYKIISVLNKNNKKEGVLYQRNIDGNVDQIVKSKLGDSFMIIDQKEADLEELSKKEKNAIMNHENLSKIDKATKYISKGSLLYGWGTTITSLGKYIIGFL